MLKVEGDKINVYIKKNYKKAKLAFNIYKVLLIVCFFVILFFIRYIFLTIAIIAFLIITFFVLYKVFVKNKSNESEMELECSLSHDEFLYKKGKKDYTINNLVNFAPLDYNYINVNYISKENKNKSIVIPLRGCNNIEFTNMANKLIKDEINSENLNNSIDSYKELSEKEIYQKLIKQKMNIECILLGKTEISQFNGKEYVITFKPSYFIFIDDNKLIYNIYYEDLKIDIDAIDYNYYYTIYYDKKTDYIICKKTDKKIDKKLLDTINKDVHISSNIIKDIKLLNFENDFLKRWKTLRNCLKIILLASLLTLLISLEAFAFCFLILIFIVFGILYGFIIKYSKKRNNL